MPAAALTDRIGLIAVVVASVALFVMAPAIIAYARRHPARAEIARMAPAGAVSFLLWGALMTWAVGGKRNNSRIGAAAGRLRASRLLWPVFAVLVLAGAIGAYASLNY